MTPRFFTFITILTLCAIFLTSLCSSGSGSNVDNDINIINERNFAVSPCSAPEVRPILATVSALNLTGDQTNTPTVLSCAVACAANHENCTFAVHRKSKKWCALVRKIHCNTNNNNNNNNNDNNDSSKPQSTAIPPPSYSNETDCKILGPKLGPNTDETDNDKEMWIQVKEQDVEHITDVDVLPMKLIIVSPTHTTICLVNHFSINDLDGIMATFHGYIPPSFVSSSSSSPPSSSSSVFSFNIYREQDGGLTTASVDIRGDRVGPDVQKEILPVNLLVRTSTNGTEGYGIVYAHTINDVFNYLSLGYRRLETERYPAVLNKYSKDDVLSERMDVVMITDVADLSLSINFTAGAEFKEPSRVYTYQYAAFGGDLISETTFDVQEPPQKGIWKFDSLWEKIPDAHLAARLDALREIVLEGNEVRLMFNGEAVSDVLEVTVTASFLIGNLPAGLDPMKNSDAKSVFFKAYTSLSKRAKCTIDLKGYRVVEANTRGFVRRIEWFRSLRKWTRLLSVDSCQNAVFGSRDELYQEATRGKNIRTCVATSEDVTICSTASRVNVFSPNTVVVQNPSVVSLTPLPNDENQVSIDSDCSQKVVLVSSEGWVRASMYNIYLHTETQRSITFDVIHWFVESF